jgi:hypothetical protein
MPKEYASPKSPTGKAASRPMLKRKGLSLVFSWAIAEVAIAAIANTKNNFFMLIDLVLKRCG